MEFAPLLAAGLLAVASVQHPNKIHPAQIVNLDDAVSASVQQDAGSGVPAGPGIGAKAPDFAYQSYDYQQRNLHHMLVQGSVLLVFGATDAQLVALEHESAGLLGSGVVPVAVVAQRESDVWRTVRRCNLTYSLMSDPHTAIAEQYGAVDGAHRTTPAWFVIDPTGRVRGSGRDVPPASNWLGLANSALGVTDVATAGTR